MSMGVTCSVYLNTLDVPTVVSGFPYRNQILQGGIKSDTGKPTSYTNSIFLEKPFVEDSLLPFKPGDNLVAKIENNRLTIAKTTD